MPTTLAEGRRLSLDTPRRACLALVVLVLFAGCGSTNDAPLPSGAIRLLTSSQGLIGCPANFIDGDLVADDSAGTAIVGTDVHLPIMWPYGYTGRRSGSVVEIVDPTGHDVAQTGTKIRLQGGESQRGTLAGVPGDHADAALTASLAASDSSSLAREWGETRVRECSGLSPDSRRLAPPSTPRATAGAS